MNPFADRRPTPKTFGHSEPHCPEPPEAEAKPKGRALRSLSRIEGMTVGDVRQCFSQMRATPCLTAETTLWCGITAGHFALRYLVNTAGSSRKKRAADSAEVPGGS